MSRLVVALLTVSVLVPVPARAAVVVGVLKLPSKFKAQPAFARPGYWRIPNNVLKVLPPLVGGQEAMVVALDGPGINRNAVPPMLVIHDARFSPPVLPVTPGTRVTFRNGDRSLHLLEATKNAKDAKGAAKLFSGKRVGPNDAYKHTFAAAGTYTVHCSEMPHLVATVLVTKKTAVALPNGKGEFRFSSVPAGSYTLRVWHQGKWIHAQPVTVRGARTNVRVQLAPFGGGN